MRAHLEPAPEAKIPVNGKNITAKTPLAPNDKITVSTHMVVVRGPDWMRPSVRIRAVLFAPSGSPSKTHV